MSLIYILLLLGLLFIVGGLFGVLLFIGFTAKFIEDNMFFFVFCGMLGVIVGICKIVAKNDERRERELKEKTKDP